MAGHTSGGVEGSLTLAETGSVEVLQEWVAKTDLAELEKSEVLAFLQRSIPKLRLRPDVKCQRSRLPVSLK